MVTWDEMDKFKTGQTPEGHTEFSVPLPPDKEGMIGRECPNTDCQPRYFKIHSLSKEAISGQENIKPPEQLHCPYCGIQAHFNKFTTRDQVDWVKSMIARDIHRSIQNMIGRTIGSSHTMDGGLFKIKLEFKSGTLPSVREYAEKELERVVKCDQCNRVYAVYGTAMFCPLCGKGNLKVHLTRSIEIIQGLMNAQDQIVEKAGKEAGYHLLGNCLEDCVSLFEGFMKIIYAERLKPKYNAKQISDKMLRLGNSFQNTSKTQDIFMNDLGLDVLSTLSSSELDFMNLQFAKRHVITHNLSLVDDKFRKHAATWQTSGQNISLAVSDIEQLLDLLSKILGPLIP